MKDFMTTMRDSLNAVRAGQPGEATRMIRRALSPTDQGTGAEAGDQIKVLPAPGHGDRRADAGAQTSRAGPKVTPKTPDSAPPPARRSFRDLIAGLSQRPAGLDLARFKNLPGLASMDGSAGGFGGGGRPQPYLPDGGQFLSGRFTHPQGSRHYRIYVPSCGQGRIRGAVLMLHGCTQNPDDFAAGTDMNRHAEAQDFMVIYPEQPRGENISLCWNWFRPGDQDAARGEPAMLAAMVVQICAEYGVPEERVFAAGLSAGGAMAAILGATHPQVFAGIGVHSGLPPGAAQDVVSAFAAMRGDHGVTCDLPVPVIVFQGLADTTVAPSNAERLVGSRPLGGVRSTQANGRQTRIRRGTNATGAEVELWQIEGLAHAWSGGTSDGTYTDAAGPDASAEMMRFFVIRGA